MKNILVVDGNSILNRAFYGIRPLTTRDGRQTAAVMGMLNILKRQTDALSPVYGAVAFDVHAKTFRHEKYDAYKAGRRPTPPELLEQFAPAKEALRLLGFPVLEMAGYEADDLQGTVAEMANGAEDLHAYILTGDRDLLQLIGPHITVLLASNSDTAPYGREEFAARFGIQPEQFVDLKAIMGDASDHIPGVPGIGEKGATKLIAAFGSLEGVYANLDDSSISKGTREKLIAGRESGELSRFLARIDTHVPLGMTLEDLALRPVDNDGLYRLFTDLEFSSLIRKYGLTPPGALKPEENAGQTAAEYRPLAAEEICRTVTGDFAIELREGEIALADAQGCYVTDAPLSALLPLFVPGRTVTCPDGKALLHALWEADPTCARDLVPQDLMLAAYVLNASAPAKSVSALAEQYLGANVADGERTVHLFALLWQRLTAAAAEQGCLALLTETELPLCRVLARMEEVGFQLDVPAMEAFGAQLLAASEEGQETVYTLAGAPFNLQSPKQLSEVLFDKLGLNPGRKKKNKSGFYSTDAETLEELRDAHPIVDAILEYRHVTKLYNTYAVGLIKAADSQGRLHTDFKQTLTATGRLSSAEPNLQNIPVRTKLGREMRRCFIPRSKDYVLVDADYSQIELRLLAAISGDEAMQETFRRGGDIHRSTAASVFHVPEEAVTEEMRKYAKAVNFGIVYGIGAFSLAKDLHCSVAEAKKYIDGYFAAYPGVRAYLDGAVRDAEEKGYTETLFGRRRTIPELAASSAVTRAFGKRVAMNSPIQGSAADIIKMAMVRVDARLSAEGRQARLVMQVHDELIVEAPRDEAVAVAEILRQEMEGAVSLPVPLTVDVSTGDTWLE